MRAPPLTVVFAGTALVSAAAIVGWELTRFGSEFVPRVRDHPGAAVYFVLASLMSATLVVFLTVVMRELRRARRPELADYRRALAAGRASGAVDAWTDWIRHDRRVNLWRAGAALWILWWAIMGVVVGQWWNAWMFAVSAYCAWDYWRTRRRLTALADDIDGATV